MWIDPLLLGVLSAVTVTAIAVARFATVRARAAQATVRAMELEHATAVRQQRRTETIAVGAVPVPFLATPVDLAPAGSEATAKVRVLVVEDEPGMREFIQRALMRSGREVVTAVGPLAALTALNSRPAISLLLVDIVMPEMDGYDLAAEARKIAPDIRVVFMSAFARDSSRHPGRDRFLSKPFTVELLIATVDNALAF
ncbi:MAG: response regulator [Acidobacteriota bacterium]|nr:response regulator [Acidobacteriota bacterium]